MKTIIKKLLPNVLRQKVIKFIQFKQQNKLLEVDNNRFIMYSFGTENNSDSYNQLEARITKGYHSIEKGLSYQKIRLGFGKEAIEGLISLLSVYKSKGYSVDAECYQVALSNLNEYILLHEKNNYDVSNIKKRIATFGNTSNNSGGVQFIKKEEILNRISNDFESFAKSRHSVRDFSKEPVDIEHIKKAINLAQTTPSACNRQGWRTRIISDPNIKKVIETNQNGNKGFGSNIDKFILITTDSQYFAKIRERNQPYIDGGMYAMNLLYSLHYYGIATVPLSAALSLIQESNIRQALNMEESENFILFIGVGNYTPTFKIPKSTRRAPLISIH